MYGTIDMYSNKRHIQNMYIRVKRIGFDFAFMDCYFIYDKKKR